MSFQYRGARALVLLHEREMRRFLRTWTRIRASDIESPATDDPDYASWDTLLAHVYRASAGYITWICERLGLPDPTVDAAPEDVSDGAPDHLEHLLERWRDPLEDVPEERFYEPEHLSRWNVRYCIDAMLEHAVLHPMRHGFQIEELLPAASD